MNDPISLEELHKLAEPYSWDDFEDTNDGHIKVPLGSTDPLGQSFYMRVGLHMKRPMQVLIAEGNFIRMRSEKRWPEWLPQFKQLDPKEPSGCIYQKSPWLYQNQTYYNQYAQMYQQYAYRGVPQHPNSENNKDWCPVMYLNPTPSNVYAQAQQLPSITAAQLQGIQGIANWPIQSWTTNTTPTPVQVPSTFQQRATTGLLGGLAHTLFGVKI